MTAYIFPGQGAQKVGMGEDFYQTFSKAREVFEAADDLLQRTLSKIIFKGPDLTETHNSQLAIFVVSAAILKVLEDEMPPPTVCAGLSLGEYTALYASGRLSFEETLYLVEARGCFMSDACEKTPGTMAAIIGLDGSDVEGFVAGINDLWVANLNCPKQVVISGTKEGVAQGIELAKERGAKRAIPLDVHGAFHSGLMREAKEKLAQKIEGIAIAESSIEFVANVSGDYVENGEIPGLLSKQVTHPVRWEAGVRAMMARGVTEFVEIGPGSILAGLNRRIGAELTKSIEKTGDLEHVEVKG